MWALRAVGGGAGGRGVAPRLRRAGRRARQKGAAPSGSCLVGGYYLMLLKCRHSRSIFSYSWHLEDTLRVDRSLSYLPSLYLTFPLRPAPETARTGAPAQRPPTRSDALAGRNPVGIEVGQPLLDAPQCEVQSGRIAVTRVSCHSVSRQPQALPPCAQIGRGRRPRVGDG